jgi:hypothetical protein
VPPAAPLRRSLDLSPPEMRRSRRSGPTGRGSSGSQVPLGDQKGPRRRWWQPEGTTKRKLGVARRRRAGFREASRSPHRFTEATLATRTLHETDGDDAGVVRPHPTRNPVARPPLSGAIRCQRTVTRRQKAAWALSARDDGGTDWAESTPSSTQGTGDDLRPWSIRRAR